MLLLPNQKSTYPIEPGVYRMLDKNSHIIYIGKAKNLRNRLSNYFDSSKKSPRISLMINDIAQIEITTTATENDALILEQKLINKIKPKFNIIFRDDKSYPFISISKHNYPKVYITREKKIDLKKENLFGPYPKREEAYKNLEIVQKIFKIRTCTDNEFAHRSRPCILHDIGKCLGPCVKQDDPIMERQYKENIINAKNLLNGNVKLTISKIKEEMEINAATLDFEAAAKNRDMIQEIESLTDNQNIYSIKEGNALVFNYVKGSDVYLGYAQVIEGVPQKIFNYIVPKEFKDLSIEELLERYIDSEIISKMNIEEKENTQLPKIKIITPLVLDNLFYKYQYTHLDTREKSWLNLVESNLKLISGENDRIKEQQNNTLNSIEKIFNNNVVDIDCIDISHFNGEATYGGKIRWTINITDNTEIWDLKSGQLDKNNYRLSRFDDNLIDDISHMRQTVEKIYHGNNDFPDILIIDGDKPQMDAAFSALQHKNITKPFILMSSAKGIERKKGDEIFHIHPDSYALINQQYMVKGELALPKNHPVRLLFQNLQDKAHNFSNSAREKRMLKDRFEH